MGTVPIFLVALFAGRGAEAFELKLWPLLDVASRAEETRLSLLGPLVEWQRRGDTSAFTLRPLLHSASDRARGETTGTLLYPFAWWNRSREALFVRFLGLATFDSESRAAPADPWTNKFTLFPFVFYRQSPETGASLSVLPFYANLTNTLGYERIRMVLFPLYLELDEPLYERTWLPFPFFSSVGGRAGAGVRLWPVYGRTRVGRASDTVYAPWPFYVRHVEHPGRQGEVVHRLSWPIFSVIEGPGFTSRSYGFLLVLPLYTHTIDRKSGTETTGFPWPMFVSQKVIETGERRSLRLAPLFQDRRSDSLRSVFYLWPVYRRRTGLGDDSGYERTDGFLLLYRNQREPRPVGALRTRVVFPLWISRDQADRPRAQAPTFVDGLFPKNDRLETLYAPLYRVYGRDGSQRDFLWRMWEWHDGRLRPPWYFSRE